MKLEHIFIFCLYWHNDFLVGIQGQFVDRTDGIILSEKEELLDQNAIELIEEKTKRLENIVNRLSKYLSPKYISLFLMKKSQAKKQKKVCKKKFTIFSDIVNFTDLSDALEAEKLALILNNYLSEMSLIAINSNATIEEIYR